MKNPLISVIMPVYNPGRYFRAAVDSVLAQTLMDFELLLIDDGSTDGSGAVCDEYAAKDSRVRVKHGRNGGICASRNAGLDLAQGEWLAFCDHDDCVEADWLAVLHEAAEREHVNVVKCGHSWQDRYPDGRIGGGHLCTIRRTGRWSLADFTGDAGYVFYSEIGSLVWDGLYCRSFWQDAGLRFNPEFKHGGEDCYLNADIIGNAGSGVVVGRVLYHHYMNIGVSTSAGYHADLLEVQGRIAQHEKEVLGFSSPAELLAMYKRWAWHLRLFVFDVPGCDLALLRRARLMSALYDEIVGRDTVVRIRDLSLSGVRVLAFFTRFRLFGTWLVLMRIRHFTWKLFGRQA